MPLFGSPARFERRRRRKSGRKVGCGYQFFRVCVVWNFQQSRNEDQIEDIYVSVKQKFQLAQLTIPIISILRFVDLQNPSAQAFHIDYTLRERYSI